MKHRKTAVVCVLLCVFASLTGCGEKHTEEISEYPGSKSDTTFSTSESSESGPVDAGHGMTLADMLAGKASTREEKTITEYGFNYTSEVVSYSDDFLIGDTLVKLELSHGVDRDHQKLPVYQVRVISRQDVHEDEIVEGLFGETAEKVKEDYKENAYADHENGFLRKTVLSDHNENVPAVPYQVDEEDYFYHTWRGSYNGCYYTLLIGYDDVSKVRFITFYPENMGDAIGRPELDSVCSSDDDRIVLWDYTSIETREFTDSDLSDPKNLTEKEDRELISMTEEFLQKHFGISYSEEALELLSTDGYGPLGRVDYGLPKKKSRLIFYPAEAYSTGNLKAAVVNGYMGRIYLGYQWIYREFPLSSVPVFTGNSGLSGLAWKADSGSFMVTDQGVAGVTCYESYILEKKLVDNAHVLSLDQLAGVIRTYLENEFDMGKVGTGRTVSVNLDLGYYTLEAPEDPSKRTIIPAWAVILQTDGIHNDYSDSVAGIMIINALDGSLIGIQ